MRFNGLWPMLAAVLLTADMSAAQDLNANPPGGVPGKERISSVVILKPGQSQQMLLSTWCTVGFTRSSGLEVGEIREGRFVTQIDKVNRGQIWKRNGVTVTVPGPQEAEKVASAPEYASFKKQGLDVFVVNVSAAKDAQPGLTELHIQDSTCNGTCQTDLRVLVAAP